MFVQLTAPFGVLGLLEGHTLPEGTRVKFKRTAAVGDQGSPLLRVSGDDRAATRTAIRSNLSVGNLTRIDDADHETVYGFTWPGGRPYLLDCLGGVAGNVLAAVANEDTWRFDCRFPDSDTARRFYTEYDDSTYPITIRRMRPDDRSKQNSDADVLTAPQRDALERALEAGYFDVPRQTSLVDLADELEISDSAMSQRLRRGLDNFLRASNSERRAVAPPRPTDE